MDFILGERRKLEFTKVIHMRPVPKASVRITKTGQAYYPKRTREAMDRVKAETMQAKVRLFYDTEFDPMTNHSDPLFSEAVYVELVFAFKYPTGVDPFERPHHSVKPDIDNLAKLTLDCLQPHILKDDCLIAELNKRKIYDEKEYIKIFIRDL